MVILLAPLPSSGTIRVSDDFQLLFLPLCFHLVCTINL